MATRVANTRLHSLQLALTAQNVASPRPDPVRTDEYIVLSERPDEAQQQLLHMYRSSPLNTSPDDTNRIIDRISPVPDETA